jgi:hypothetical protein
LHQSSQLPYSLTLCRDLKLRPYPPQKSTITSHTILRAEISELADVAKTLKNSGASLQGAKTPSSSILGRASTVISGATTSSYSHSNPPKQDKRLLITVEPGALLFALRQELSAKITGLTLASIPTIAPTRTGWAITPADLSTRDLLMDQNNAETILRIFKATAIKQPETWYNYAVPGVPSTIHQLMGDTLTNTAELVSEEVWAQAKQRPISCRPSRHGANPKLAKSPG